MAPAQAARAKSSTHTLDRRERLGEGLLVPRSLSGCSAETLVAEIDAAPEEVVSRLGQYSQYSCCGRRNVWDRRSDRVIRVRACATAASSAARWAKTC
ncbi:MAG: hypothetical protein HYV07_00070 [Deltaproteobacteria bacterium]|nr:hypothetical protein [Deltaproteobacteria bacterium]